jgi:hypothetical protein
MSHILKNNYLIKYVEDGKDRQSKKGKLRLKEKIKKKEDGWYNKK